MAGNYLPDKNKSVLGRYSEECRIRVNEFTGATTRHISFGRKLLGELRHSLAQGGISVGSRKVNLPDGTRVTAAFDGTTNNISITGKIIKNVAELICGFYEESGLLGSKIVREQDYLEITTPILYRAAQGGNCVNRDNYGSPLKKFVQKHINAFFKEITENILVSLAFTPKTVNDEVSSADLRALYDFIKYNSRLSPSMYSGKLQLFIQSVMGAKNALYRIKAYDVFLDNPDVYEYPYYTIDEIQLDFNRTKCHGLMTIPDYKGYVLLELGPTCNATRIQLTPCGELLLGLIRIGVKKNALSKEDIKKLESLILSKARFGDTYPIEMNIIDPVIEGPIGEYGWHFNWNGSKADIIEVDTSNATKEPTTLPDPPPDPHLISRQYQITFEYAPVKDRKTGWLVSLVTAQQSIVYTSGKFRKGRRARIWHYDYFFSRRMFRNDKYTTLVINSFGDIDHYGFDQPNRGAVYGFYNSNDEFKHVIYRFEPTPGVPCPSLDEAGGYNFWAHCDLYYSRRFEVPCTECGDVTDYGFAVDLSVVELQSGNPPASCGMDGSNSGCSGSGTSSVQRLATQKAAWEFAPSPYPASGSLCHPTWAWGKSGWDLGGPWCPNVYADTPTYWLQFSSSPYFVDMHNYEVVKNSQGTLGSYFVIPQYDCESVIAVQAEFIAQTFLVDFNEMYSTGYGVRFIYQGQDVKTYGKLDGCFGGGMTWGGVSLLEVQAPYFPGIWWWRYGGYTTMDKYKATIYSKIGHYHCQSPFNVVTKIPKYGNELSEVYRQMMIWPDLNGPISDSFSFKVKRGLSDYEIVFPATEDPQVKSYDVLYTCYKQTYTDYDMEMTTYVGWA